MTTDETTTEKIPAVRDGHTGELAVIPPDADDAWLAMLRDDGQPLADLRTVDYPGQVVAALHGDPAVFTLDALTQECIASVSRVFEHIARSILAQDNRDTADTWTDPRQVTRRAAVLLMAGGEEGGTPMRCPACSRIHQPLAIGGEINWDVAGREDIMCPPCWQKQPKHTAPSAPAKAKAAAGTRRRRTSQARKAATAAPPDAA